MTVRKSVIVTMAVRGGVVVLAAVAVAIGVAGVGGTPTTAEPLASAYCDREADMMKYWGLKAQLAEDFLFDSSTVAHYWDVQLRHMLNYSNGGCGG
jgi:site-specific recombinase